jgi:small subunit ribosomal protein S9
MEKQKNAVGRRKEAVTRVFLSKGEGKITINGKDYKAYFPLVYLQNQVEAPFKTVEATDKFDVVLMLPVVVLKARQKLQSWVSPVHCWK